MGFVLVEGIMAHLRGAPGVAPSAGLRLLAEKIAAGDMAAVAHGAQSEAAAQAALVAGFGAVLVYGAASVFVLAGASWLVFSPGKAARRGQAA